MPTKKTEAAKNSDAIMDALKELTKSNVKVVEKIGELKETLDALAMKLRAGKF